MILFGDIEYFVLLDLRDKLKRYDYDKLDLLNLDRLRAEVERKIYEIHALEESRKINE